MIEERPRYLAARQHLGRLLNDLRDHRAARDCLERARELGPASARTLCETGRACFGLGDVGTAQQ